MTQARGVSQSPQNTRHAARDFRQDGNEKQKITMHVILDLKLKNTIWKYQKFVQSRWLAIQNEGEMIRLSSLIFPKTQKQKKSRL